MARHDIKLTVNGAEQRGQVESRLLLVHFLRENLRLTGTHIGCDTTHCGACTVLLDGEPVKSCTILAVQADGAKITTVEGLEQNGKLHPIQEAFWDKHGLQCGFCTPGMVMVGVDIAKRLPDADEKTVRRQLEGNLCRCTGYQGIVEAIMTGTDAMQGRPPRKSHHHA